jgi:anaerobic magnesium-protoporphyrin IX monomethyl ester cyclase
MKILFIYPSLDISYPLQLGALSAYVKKSGHQSRLFSLILPTGLKNSDLLKVKKSINDFRPDFIGFSGYETAFNWIESISKYIKKHNQKIKIIVGGYYPTLVPNEVIASPYIDIICRSEGELPLKELFDDPKRTDIKNLWFKKGKKVIKNPVRPLIEKLDQLPFPDRDMLDYQSHLDDDKVGERTVKVMASRGCPYNCTYCSNTYLRAVVPNKEKYLRIRSPQNVIDEIVYLRSKYKFDKVGFHDDNLTLDVEWLKAFTKLYKKHINLPYYCATRVERCSDSTLKLLKNSGCELLLIGIESGNQKYRTDMMKRFMTNDQIISCFKRARKIGLLTWSFTMVGLPYETHLMLIDTLILNWKCRPDFVMASIFYPLRGTDLGDVCYKNNWVNQKKRESVATYAWETILDHPTFPPFEIKLFKYLNLITAARSPLFWKLALQRFRDFSHS